MLWKLFVEACCGLWLIFIEREGQRDTDREIEGEGERERERDRERERERDSGTARRPCSPQSHLQARRSSHSAKP